MEFTIKRDEIGKASFWVQDKVTGDWKPCCMIGHIMDQLGVKPEEASYDECGGGLLARDLPEPLHFLRDEDKSIDGGYCYNATFTPIAHASDKGRHDEAVRLLKPHGIHVNLV